MIARPVYVDFSTRYSVQFPEYRLLQRGICYQLIQGELVKTFYPIFDIWSNYILRGISGEMFFRDLDTGKAILIYANSHLEAGETLLRLRQLGQGIDELKTAERESPRNADAGATDFERVRHSMKLIVTGETKVLGIIGSPVRHSLSPLMHNAAIEALDLDYVYVPFPVPSDRLKDAVKGLRSLGVAGFNVTIPFKTAIIPYLDRLTPDSGNGWCCQYCQQGRGPCLSATIPMGRDCSSPLKEDLNFAPAGSSILILGAGGAARGALAAFRYGRVRVQ